jgi:hypothetical protein
MKRAIVLILILLPLGFITSLAVAIASALWLTIDIADATMYGDLPTPEMGEGSGWYVQRHEQPGYVYVGVIFNQSMSGAGTLDDETVFPFWSDLDERMDQAVRQSVALDPGGLIRDRVNPTMMHEDGRGWPMACLHHRFDLGLRNHSLRAGVDGFEGGWIINDWPAPVPGRAAPVTEARVIPYLPVWPGLIVDTLFYAIVPWGLLLGPWELRRITRIRRGRCPKCGYPAGRSDVCTECGRALPERIVRVSQSSA